jgi:tellurite resistance-related uncharacterized protein
LNRTITGFHLDEVGDMVADLDCHHGRHVRHNPPFDDRPWTQSEEGRAKMLGREMNCVRCDHAELPDGVLEYKRTTVFTELSVPKGLLSDHKTRRGVWGVVTVVEGQLLYAVGTKETALTAGDSAVIVPEQLHRVQPVGVVRFYVGFLKP